MKRIGRALAKRLTYANVVATCALFLAMGGTAAAAVLISSNSQVASNTISGHQPPSGKHSNLIAGSVNGTDLARATKTALKLHCPVSLQQGGDLCFDPTPRAATTWVTALGTCANAGLRLASVGELSQVFDHTGAPQPSQWTDAVFFNGTSFQATLLSNNASRQIGVSAGALNNGVPFRCVTTTVN